MAQKNYKDFYNSICVARFATEPAEGIRQSGDKTLCNFRIARNTGKTDKDGNSITQFVSVTVWGEKKCEFIKNNFKKGDRALFTIDNESPNEYTTKDGQKVQGVEWACSDVAFFGGKNDSNQNSHQSSTPAATPKPAAASNAGFIEIPETIEEELPFN